MYNTTTGDLGSQTCQSCWATAWHTGRVPKEIRNENKRLKCRRHVSYKSARNFLPITLVGYFVLCVECVGKIPTKVPEDFSRQYKSDHSFHLCHGQVQEIFLHLSNVQETFLHMFATKLELWSDLYCCEKSSGTFARNMFPARVGNMLPTNWKWSKNIYKWHHN